MKLEILFKTGSVNKTTYKIESLRESESSIRYYTYARNNSPRWNVVLHQDTLQIKLDGEQIYIDPEYEKEQVEKMRNGIKALVNIDKSLKSLFEELRGEYDDEK